MSPTSAAGLSTEQSGQLKRVRDRWEALRISTAAADRSAAEAGVWKAYHASGLQPPTRIVWCRGPLELARERAAQVACRAAGAGVCPEVVTGPLRQVDRKIREQVAPALLYQIRHAATPHTLTALSRAVIQAVASDTDFGLVRRPVWRRVWDRLTHRSRQSRADESLTEAGLSQHDAPPFYTYDYLREDLGLARTVRPVEGLMQVASSCGWFVPHEHVCFLAERHDVLRRDPLGRLHAADGPALRYADQWCRYFWKGVEVAPWMIEQPDWLDLGRMDREPDPVIRHCMVDIMTPEQFIRNGNAKRVMSDECGVLWQYSWRLGGVWAAVEVVNGTPEPDGCRKHYFLTVPGNLRSARQAVAWTYGLNKWEYDALRLRT